MRDLLARFGRRTEAACRCDPTVASDSLVLDASDCPGAGDLAGSPVCRRTAVEALDGRDVECVRTESRGRSRRYRSRSVAVLVAAARFAVVVRRHDDRLADLASTDPVAAGREAAGRSGPVARIAAETGLLVATEDAPDTASLLTSRDGATIAQGLVDPSPPPDARLVTTRDTDGSAVTRVYDAPGSPLPVYHVVPPELTFDDAALAGLADAYDLLGSGAVGAGPRAAWRAVARVLDDDEAVEPVADCLRRHTRGFGVLECVFADPGVSDAFVTAPAGENPLRVRVDGEAMTTNVTLPGDGAAVLASRVRAASGRAFSRADPTLDAVLDDVGAADRLRVAGVTDPVSDGAAFAFRAHGGDPWTLDRIVGAGTLPPEAAALLSLAVERDAAVLVAGPRGAGKTTLLGALLFELPPAVRAVVIEDTPELPIAALQADDRDVQGLTTAVGDGPAVSPADALRTALRLGEGALAVGEVRGAEAPVLFEAMRVGAGGGAVLGTAHGNGASEVRDRLVDDLGVPGPSFAATDLVVTLEPAPDGKRLVAVEEVHADGFAALFEGADGEAATGRIERGNSEVVAGLAGPDETYASVRELLARRTDRFREAGSC